MEETNSKFVADIKSVFKSLVVGWSRNVRNRPGVCPWRQCSMERCACSQTTTLLHAAD